jgi:SAM-dependent methyltransferase
MSKKRDPESSSAVSSNSVFGSLSQSQDWQHQISAVADRFNREYRGEHLPLPDEVQAMPIFQEWKSGLLQAHLISPFWQLARPQKHQRCLDIGCGVSFLIYPWRDWDALFYGQEISPIAQEMLNARGPQLNSKLFKGVQLGAAHQMEYEPAQFDLAIATGVSCYYPLSYWAEVLSMVKRILKPGSFFVFDVLDAEAPLAENWAILETYLGAEVFLESAADWNALIQSTGAKIVKTQESELLRMYKVKF